MYMYVFIILCTLNCVQFLSLPPAKAHISSVYDPISIVYGGWEAEHIYNYLVDLFKFLKIKGLVCSGAFITLPGDLRHVVNQNTTEHKPFGAQVRRDLGRGCGRMGGPVHATVAMASSYFCAKPGIILYHPIIATCQLTYFTTIHVDVLHFRKVLFFLEYSL